MRDMERQTLNRLVLGRLREPGFRERLVARDIDGTHPIVLVAVEDSVQSMLGSVARVGGAANVVVPYLNGFVVAAVLASEPTPARGDALLAADCTVGVLLARVRQDGNMGSYSFVAGDSSGQAELVAIAG